MTLTYSPQAYLLGQGLGQILVVHPSLATEYRVMINQVFDNASLANCGNNLI